VSTRKAVKKPAGPPAQLAGWVILGRFGTEPWELVSTTLMTRQEASRRLANYREAASRYRKYTRARVVLEDGE